MHTHSYTEIIPATGHTWVEQKEEEWVSDGPVGNASYTLKKDPIYETVYHDEVGHYEELGQFVVMVTAGYMCSVCGATK